MPRCLPVDAFEFVLVSEVGEDIAQDLVNLRSELDTAVPIAELASEVFNQ